MAEGHVPNAGQQRGSKIARFIPRPQRVIPKKLENFTQLLPNATSNVPSGAEPHSQTVLSSSNHHSAGVPADEALKRTHKNLKIGDLVSIGESKHGVLRYYGETHFAEGILCGVELEDAVGGKHSGTVDGVAYFVCRPNHGIFVPEPNVKLRIQQSVPTLPELSPPVQVENDLPAVKPKSASPLSRLPKLGFSGYLSKSKQREVDTREEACELAGHHTDCRSEASLYHVEDAPLWRDTNNDDSPVSDSEDQYHQDSSLYRHVSPEVLQELRNALMSELPPQQPAPDPSTAVKNALSPIHENSDECENRSVKKTLSQSPEGAVGGVDFLSPIAEIMDEMDDGSKQESLGILTDGAMRDITVSIDGVLPNSFSTDDVADLLDDEVEDNCAPCTTLTPNDTVIDDNIPMISSNVLRILQYNFPDQVDYLNTVVARSGAIITNEPPSLSRSASETSPSVATDLNTDDSSARKASDSLECSSGFATSIGSVECEFPGAADALTAVNLSSLQGEDVARPKRPTSAYTVRSADTGFQGDSEYQSEAGTAVSPCEDKMMRWSTCSSQDSGAVSESEFQRRNLHPDCCSDCDRVPSPAGRHLPSLRLQTPESKNPMLAMKQDEAASAPQEQPAASSEDADAAASENQAVRAEDSSPDTHPADLTAECQASEVGEPATRADLDKQEAGPSEEAKVSGTEKAAAKAEKTVSKRVPISFPKQAPKVVVSKVKAMIEASKAESEEAAKRVVRPPKKSRWDEVTSKLAASMADDKVKPKVKEVRSRVFTNLEGAKQQPVRPNALLPTLRKSLRCNTSSRGSVRTEADDATPTSDHHHASPAGDSSKDDTAGSTTTAAEGSIMKGADAASIHSSGKGAASVKSALSERKTKPPPKRPDYPRPWNVCSKPATKEEASMSRPALSRRTSPTQPKPPCMHNKTVHFSSTLPGSSTPRRPDAKKATTGAATRLSAPGGPASKVGEARVQAQTKAEFTREIQRLGALCESRTKELTMLKMQLRHASTGFSSFGVIIQHLSAQNDSFCIPKLSEELQKSQEEIEKARVAIEAYKSNIEEIKRNQEQEIEALKAELEGKHALKIQELEAAHKNELTCYLESHTRKLEEMKAFYTDIIEGDRKSHEETLDSLKQRHREKIDAINEEYSLQLDSIHEDHQARQQELDLRHEALLQQHHNLQQKAQEFQESVLLDTDAKIQWLSKKNAELQKEVESLNVVLEMRADQIQNLQRNTVDMERKEEELDRCKARMEKMEARIEDLQELLNEKVKVQSQLSVENAKLRETSEKQNRQLSRLDMHNEELKYKLRESVNSSMLDGPGQPRSRNSSHKRYSVADPTAMSQSWHAAEHRSTSRASNGKPLGGAHGLHRGTQGSQSLPRGCSDGFHPRMRRSMSETSPPQDACVRQLFASFVAGDSSDNSLSTLGDATSTPRQCSQDDLLRLTWVKEDGGLLQPDAAEKQSPLGGSS